MTLGQIHFFFGGNVREYRMLDTGPKYYFSWYKFELKKKQTKTTLFNKYGVSVLKLADCLTKWELFS